MMSIDNYKNGSVRYVGNVWLNDVGIVKGYDEITGETKYYFGRACGMGEYNDIIHIMTLGTKITQEQANELFKNFFKELDETK